MKGRSTPDDGEVDYRALFEAAPGLYLVLAPDQKIVAASDAYLRAAKAEESQIVGRRLSDVFPEGRPETGADRRRWSRANFPVLAPDGRLAHVIHRVEDVTHLSELEESVVELRTARDKAEQASQLKTRFLGMVSHELRTPLTALSLQVERMQRYGDGLDARHGESLQRIAFSASRLREMIETLLEYARIEGGRVTMNIAPFDLAQTVSRIVEHHRYHAEQKGLAIRGSIFGSTLGTTAGSPCVEPAMVVSDQRLVELIVSNLVDNAIKFTSAGSVEIALGRAVEGTFRVSVHDSGPGIPAEQQAEIFEPFQQLAPAAFEHPPGIGLGLALVRDIAAVLGGRVEVSSVHGEGSTFTLLLPVSITGRTGV